MQFFTISLAIFSCYDTSYLTMLENGVSTACKIQDLYSIFVEKEGKKDCFC